MRRDIADRIPDPTIVIMVRARRMNGVGVMQRHLARLKRHRDAVIFAEAVVDRLTEADQVILLRFSRMGKEPVGPATGYHPQAAGVFRGFGERHPGGHMFRWIEMGIIVILMPRNIGFVARFLNIHRRVIDQNVDAYRRDGFLGGIPVLNASEVNRFRAELEVFEATTGKPLDFPERSKSYMLFGWAYAIVHHPPVLDAVEDVIGPDILVYHSTTWIKEAGTPSYVLWHQDGKYFFLEPHLHVTAWVALSDSTVESGCVHALPGSHKWGDFEHRDDLGEWNMIKRGQGIPDRFDNETGVPLELKAGEMSLHHTDLVHCSRGNGGADRRIGLGISYIPASVRQTGSPQATALLVRGQAAPGAFGAEQRLDRGMSDAAQQAHAHSVGLFRARQDKGTQMARQATA